MIIKGIAATTHLDKHNFKFTKVALENIVKDINESIYAIKVGVEHDSSIMPIGKILSGKVIELEDGEYGIEIEQEIFEETHIYVDDSNRKWYVTESRNDIRPFSDTQIEKIQNIRIGIDSINFEDNAYEHLLNFYEKECFVDTQCIMRKGVIPIPEIIITLVTGTFAVMTGKKISEKMSEHIADDVVKIYDLLKKIVLETVKHCKESRKSITYLIRENREFLLELVVITEKTEVLFEALESKRIDEIETEIQGFLKNFDVTLAKVQCIYDKTKNKWLINYVSTIDGKVIGSEKCYKKTVEFRKRAGTGLSLGMIENLEHN